MESRRVWGDDKPLKKQARRADNDGSQAPMRLAVLFSGNGFHSGQFHAKGAGSTMELGQVLAPIAGFRERITFIRGLFNEQALKGNIHSSQTGNMLSGAPLASGGAIRSGTSFDQVIAQRYGRSTRVGSLVLGCERSNPGIHKDYSMLYSSHISWSSPTNPTPLEVYPALAFDRLFNSKIGRGDQSVLDAVLAEARRFRKGISRIDQRKFDEYLNSVREVERRIDRAGEKGELQGWRPTLEKPNIPRPPDGIPQDLPEHMKLMCDLVVLASIGLTLLIAVGGSGLVSGFSADLLGWVGLGEELSWLVKLLTVVLGLAANALLFFTIFKLLGRAEVPNRSLWSGAILGAVLFELLKRLAGLIIAQTQGQPAFQAFGIALVMLVWINYFSRLVLYAAAWAYTAPEARAAREAAASETDADPVQGPPLPSGEDTPLADASAGSRSPAKPFLAGVAAGAGVLLAARRRKDDD